MKKLKNVTDSDIKKMSEEKKEIIFNLIKKWEDIYFKGKEIELSDLSTGFLMKDEYDNLYGATDVEIKENVFNEYNQLVDESEIEWLDHEMLITNLSINYFIESYKEDQRIIEKKNSIFEDKNETIANKNEVIKELNKNISEFAEILSIHLDFYNKLKIRVDKMIMVSKFPYEWELYKKGFLVWDKKLNGEYIEEELL